VPNFPVGSENSGSLDRIEKRLSMLEGVLWAMVQYRQSQHKRKTTFDYIESWLSTTVPRSSSGSTPEEETIRVMSDFAMEEFVTIQ
jgi:hypothetical protein